jgi:phage gp29-like protein
LWDRLIDLCNREISKAVLGQTLTTEVGKTGSYAAGRVHGEVRQDLVEADGRAIEDVLQRDILGPLVFFNFGEDAVRQLLPKWRIKTEPPEDLKQAADTYQVLISQIGLPVAKDHLYDRFHIPKPEAKQETVGLQPPPIGAATMPIANTIGKILALSAGQTDGQVHLDRAGDHATNLAAPMMQALFRPLMERLSKVETVEDIMALKEQLLQDFKGMDPAELTSLLQRAMVQADLYGRWAVSQRVV